MRPFSSYFHLHGLIPGCSYLLSMNFGDLTQVLTLPSHLSNAFESRSRFRKNAWRLNSGLLPCQLKLCPSPFLTICFGSSCAAAVFPSATSDCGTAVGGTALPCCLPHAHTGSSLFVSPSSFAFAPLCTRSALISYANCCCQLCVFPLSCKKQLL